MTRCGGKQSERDSCRRSEPFCAQLSWSAVSDYTVAVVPIVRFTCVTKQVLNVSLEN